MDLFRSQETFSRATFYDVPDSRFLHSPTFHTNHVVVLEATSSKDTSRGGSLNLGMSIPESLHLSFPRDFLAPSESCHSLIN